MAGKLEAVLRLMEN